MNGLGLDAKWHYHALKLLNEFRPYDADPGRAMVAIYPKLDDNRLPESGEDNILVWLIVDETKAIGKVAKGAASQWRKRGINVKFENLTFVDPLGNLNLEAPISSLKNEGDSIVLLVAKVDKEAHRKFIDHIPAPQDDEVQIQHQLCRVEEPEGIIKQEPDGLPLDTLSLNPPSSLSSTPEDLHFSSWDEGEEEGEGDEEEKEEGSSEADESAYVSRGVPQKPSSLTSSALLLRESTRPALLGENQLGSSDTGQQRHSLDSTAFSNIEQRTRKERHSDTSTMQTALARHTDGTVKMGRELASINVAGNAPFRGAPPPVKEVKPVSVELQKLFASASLEELEAGVQKGIELLKRLQDLIEPTVNDATLGHDSTALLKQMETVRAKANVPRTVLGVVGNTGAGKSSVINALLEEERIVPTNCMRACTAVVTEISYNHSTEDKYRAEIEFVSKEDWRKELEILFGDLIENGQVSRNCSRAETEAGVAWAKFKAVYPQKTKDDLLHTSVERLMDDPRVSKILGSVHPIAEEDSLKFYRKLQKYVDSNEKTTKDDKSKGPKQLDYWPLIKVVKIFLKADTLKTGAVLVDLPGAHDSNAARATVADKYKQQCSGLWIVAPITRAVDDKTAHTLLGDAFRRQLMMDGGFSESYITFICSKSDEISVTEASASLGLEDELAESMDRLKELEQQAQDLEDKIEELEEQQNAAKKELANLDEELERWEDLEDEVRDEGKVARPKKRDTKKRKRNSSSGSKYRVSKRSRRHRTDEDSSEISDSESDDDSDEAGSQISSDEDTYVTLEEYERVVKELRTKKRAARNGRSKISEQISALKGELRDINKEQTEIENKTAAICIKGRNEYSRLAIKEDFAAGLEEMDREIAEEKDPENFDPTIQLRDYQAIAKGLDVFCVSSRAYQKMCGRLKKDGGKPVFSDINETEIPALRDHCINLTKKVRGQTARSFLNGLEQLLNTLSLWSTSQSKLFVEEQVVKAESALIRRKLDDLGRNLGSNAEGTANQLKEKLQVGLFDLYPQATKAAERAAVPTCTRWGAPVNRANPSEGGYYWSTYRATVKRNGEYAGGVKGKIDWNEELSTPLIKVIATAWEDTFQQKIPQLVAGQIQCFQKLLNQTQDSLRPHLTAIGLGQHHIAVLDGQFKTYQAVYKDDLTQIVNTIQTAQRDLNRQFTIDVQRQLLNIYATVSEQSGPGCYARMKSILQAGIESLCATMFQNCVNTVRNALLDLVENMKGQFHGLNDKILNCLIRDIAHTGAFGDRPPVNSIEVPRPTVKVLVEEIVKRVESDFKTVLTSHGRNVQLEMTQAVSAAGKENGTEGIRSDALEPYYDDEDIFDSYEEVPDEEQSFYDIDDLDEVSDTVLGGFGTEGNDSVSNSEEDEDFHSPLNGYDSEIRDSEEPSSDDEDVY